MRLYSDKGRATKASFSGRAKKVLEPKFRFEIKQRCHFLEACCVLSQVANTISPSFSAPIYLRVNLDFGIGILEVECTSKVRGKSG